MWCFGSMRMFLDHANEFAGGWTYSHDVIWEKNAGTSFANDRFRRIHENALFWYRGPWSEIYHHTERSVRRGGWSDRSALRPVGEISRGDRPGQHLGQLDKAPWQEDGTRLPTSILRAKNLRGLAIHPTEKPVNLLRPLIEYACPPGGLVLDPFAGSGAVLDAARQTGRRAIGIEAHEPYAEKAARRLSQGVLNIGDAP